MHILDVLSSHVRGQECCLWVSQERQVMVWFVGILDWIPGRLTLLIKKSQCILLVMLSTETLFFAMQQLFETLTVCCSCWLISVLFATIHLFQQSSYCNTIMALLVSYDNFIGAQTRTKEITDQEQCCYVWRLRSSLVLCNRSVDWHSLKISCPPVPVYACQPPLLPPHLPTRSIA